MQTLLTIIHVIVCIFLCLVVLLQSGRAGGMGAAFGGATSQIFGGRGAGNFLSRLTSIAAVVFFFTSLTLSVLSSRQFSVYKGKAEAPAATEGADKGTADAQAVEAAPAEQPAAAPAPANPGEQALHPEAVPQDAAKGTAPAN